MKNLTIRFGNVPVCATNMVQVVDSILEASVGKKSLSISVADVHSVMEARRNEIHLSALKSSDIVTPDGMPIVLVGKLLGSKDIGRVSGADLMGNIFDHKQNQLRHYFLGGSSESLAKLVENISSRWPNVEIAGSYSPPYRLLSQSETRAMNEKILESGANIVWVGLGCPKQEIWILSNKRELGGVTLVGVGAAFDFLSGTVKRCPKRLRDAGLEWAYRLASEPRRLWKRYLIDAPTFCAVVLLGLLSGKVNISS